MLEIPGRRKQSMSETITIKGAKMPFTHFRMVVYWIMLFIVITLPAAEIHDAVQAGDLSRVKALVTENPGLVNEKDNRGRSPLHYAAFGGSVDLIEFLVGKGAKLEPQDPQRQTPLHYAATYDKKDAVAALLKRGAAIEAREDYQRTPLILCAREQGQAPTARLLIAAGADINAKDKFGSDALELAAWRGKRDFVDLLLEKGAQVPESGERWHAGIQEAASQGLETLFRRLAEKVRDLKSAGGEGLLYAAAEGGSPVIIGLILDSGYDPAKADRFGWTPLHYAARDGRSDAVRLLVDRKAPLDARTLMGQTAFNVSRERGFAEVAALLEEKGADCAETRFPVLKGDYLGQKPPAGKPELFGPGIVSSIWGLHSPTVFSPTGEEIYWKPMVTFPGEIYSKGTMLVMKRIKGRWTPPAAASFSTPETSDDVPVFSGDGKRIYFLSRRPQKGETGNQAERIWFADRKADSWSEPQPLDLDLGGLTIHWQFSLDGEGNLYLGGRGADSRGGGDLYLARFRSGKYEKPVNLGDPFNTQGNEDCPFIAADGSFFLFTRQFDVWISFRGSDGAWGTPVKLGPEVNSVSIEVCPQVTPDGKYLFFLSQRGGESHAYWVNAAVIEQARPQTPTAAEIVGKSAPLVFSGDDIKDCEVEIGWFFPDLTIIDARSVLVRDTFAHAGRLEIGVADPSAFILKTAVAES